MKQKITVISLLLLALGWSAAPAWAHHSFSMFDMSKRVKVEGAVKEFQWTNPHAWLQIMGPNEKGEIIEWSLELGSPNMLGRSGIKKTTFLPGQKIAIEMSPMRDGTPGGALSSAVFPDGTVIRFSAGGNSGQVIPPTSAP